MILVYNDNGVDKFALEQTIARLQESVQHEDIQTVDAEFIKNNSNWDAATTLLIIPGGRARAYNQSLGDLGNRRIMDYVKHGGNYLGICAGAYYAAANTIFEKDTALAIHDKGSLYLYPGDAVGPAYGTGKFQYDADTGAQIAEICYQNRIYQIYYNGGCYFAASERKTNILAQYNNIETKPAAIVECTVGAGRAILTGVHVEISFYQKQQFFADQQALELAEKQREELFDSILRRLQTR